MEIIIVANVNEKTPMIIDNLLINVTKGTDGTVSLINLTDQYMPRPRAKQLTTAAIINSTIIRIVLS